MVYECPQCKTPLPPGASSCARCGLQFATPIPADATLPASGTAPAYEETSTYEAMSGSDGQPPRRTAAIVAAIGIVLIAIAVFAIYSFTHTSAPPTPEAGIPAPPVVMPYGRIRDLRPSNDGSGASGAMTLPPGTAPSNPTQSNEGALVGHWQSKNLEIYVFNADGTGSRGSSSGGKSEAFTWVVSDNELTINTKHEEKLSFNIGPDNNSLYLRLPSGRFTQFQRVGA